MNAIENKIEKTLDFKKIADIIGMYKKLINIHFGEYYIKIKRRRTL